MPTKGVAREFKDAQERFVDQVDGDWALVTAGTEESGWNTMTIGWGSAGTLWGLPVVAVYVHPRRYTHEFLQREDHFTVQLFGEERRQSLRILGSRSGRDGDKVALAQLTPRPVEHGMTFEEAEVTLVCRKLYAHPMVLENVPADIRGRMGALYAADAHTVFVGQLVSLR